MKTAIELFAELLEKEQIEYLHKNNLACEANLHNTKVRINIGKKYIKVDIGGSGKYMVTLDRGEIFGIKAYGVIHRGHPFGTLDTINEWNWGGYGATRKDNYKAPLSLVEMSAKSSMDLLRKEPVV